MRWGLTFVCTGTWESLAPEDYDSQKPVYTDIMYAPFYDYCVLDARGALFCGAAFLNRTRRNDRY